MWRQVLKCRTLSGRSAACVPKHRIVPSGASSSASSCLVPNKSVWMESSGGSKGGRPGSEDLLSTPGFYDNMIQKYASQHNEQFTMKELLEQGKAAWEKPGVVLENAQFLQRELPKRLAKRLLDLQFLPYIVVINPNIKRVYEAYYNAFQTLRQVPFFSFLSLPSGIHICISLSLSLSLCLFPPSNKLLCNYYFFFLL